MPPHDPLNDDLFSRLEINRRELVRRLVVGTAFAVPVVASFDMATLTTGTAEALAPNQVGVFYSNQPLSAPAFTSAAAATFVVGQAGSFVVTASGPPTPSIETGSTLPAGVTLVDNGDGSATLAGTPQAGSGGVYDLELIASNGVSPEATQSFTLTVHQAPTIASPDTAVFTVGEAGSAVVIAEGFPTPSVAKSGALPSGLGFAGNDTHGTGVIAGAPAAGTEGVHPVTISAANGVSPSATQKLSIGVDAKPKAKPSNQFTITDVSVSSDGTVRFELTLPGAGAVTVLETVGGQRFAHQTQAVKRAGTEAVRVAPSSTGARLVRNHPSQVSITLAVTFTPTGGRGHTTRVRGLQLP